jgi:hypothetical protein
VIRMVMIMAMAMLLRHLTTRIMVRLLRTRATARSRPHRMLMLLRGNKNIHINSSSTRTHPTRIIFLVVLLVPLLLVAFRLRPRSPRRPRHHRHHPLHNSSRCRCSSQCHCHHSKHHCPHPHPSRSLTLTFHERSVRASPSRNRHARRRVVAMIRQPELLPPRKRHLLPEVPNLVVIMPSSRPVIMIPSSACVLLLLERWAWPSRMCLRRPIAIPRGWARSCTRSNQDRHSKTS